MDDEIDIEEHDILEHPQVKAAFPDLSKIQIQVHTSGGFNLDETSEQTEANIVSLIEERQDYAENDLVDESHEIEFVSENGDVNTAQECSDRDPLKLKITDENIVNVEDKNTDTVREIPENILDEVLEISDDEFIDEAQLYAPDEFIIGTEKAMSLAEFTEQARAIAKSQELIISTPELKGKVHEIFDDELETRELAEKVNGDELIEKDPKNGDELTAVINGDEFIESAPENDYELSEEVHENGVEYIEETPQNTDDFIAEVIEDNQGYGEDGCMDEIIIPEQNRPAEVEPEYSKVAIYPQEYPDVPIKEEFFDVPIKEETDDIYQTEHYNFEESFPDETITNDKLPPEDFYHFNNKIILGSKPNPQVQGSVDIRRNKLLVVLLKDWGVQLSRSPSFCKNCKILFTTPNALDAHKMMAHSLLAPITNRAVKSTAKISVTIPKSTTGVKNIARKSTGSKPKDISNSTYCNHCNVTFRDHTALIKHLYELLPAKQYPCSFCDESFQNQNDLLTHKSVHVKLEPRKILKPKKYFDKNPLLRSLLTKDVKQINPKIVKQVHPKAMKRSYPIEIKMESPVTYKSKYSSRYKCMVCSDILDTYNQARQHRLTHTEVLAGGKRAMVLKRLLEKNVNPINSKDKITYEEVKSNKKQIAKNNPVKNQSKCSVEASTKENPFELIPKSVLFQCSKCNVHFSSCFAGASHMARNSCGVTRLYSCSTCKKKLRKQDESCHRKQHELCTKIKIYKITKNTYERTLCRCLKCGVHFDYILLKMHIKSCGKIPVAKCLKCNIFLPKNKLANHAKKHDLMKMKPKDFNIVEYAVVNDKSKLKPATVANKKANNRKADTKYATKENIQGKKIKVEPKAIKAEPRSVQKQSNIINKLTFEKEKVRLYFCKHCKCFLSGRNKSLSNKTHLSRRCLGAYKYKTCNCEWCGLQIPQKSRIGHEKLHSEHNVTIKDFEFCEFATLKPITPPVPKFLCCNKCKIHFLSRSMKKKHICGEDYDNCQFCGDKFEMSALEVHRLFHSLKFAEKGKLTQSEPSNQAKIMPELMKKYESLNAIWNILFICGKCELVTDLYNKAVEHSQAHLKKDQTQNNTIKCYICNLKFDESCWSKHSELHSRMKINRKDFKMLKYMPHHLLDESWFQMFENLPEKEIRQIIDRSVFGSERSLKMRLVKDGLPEFTIYCCSNCRVSFDNNNILDHVKSKCKTSTNVCSKCDIAFDDANTLQFHELLHRKGIKEEEFRIVHFVKVSNDTITTSLKDKKIMKAKEKKDVVNSKDLKQKKKITKKGQQFLLYKCEECSVCVHMKINLMYHICAPEHHLIFCKICKQNFSFRQIGAHREKHNKLREFKAINTKVISFAPIPEGKDKPRRKNYHRKSSKPRFRPTISKNEPTSSTNKLASTKSSENDLASVHSSDKRRSSVDSFESLVNVITSEKHTKSKERKPLNSPKLSLRTVSTESTELQTDDKRTAKVYKCDCGLHYTTLRTIEKHIETCNNDNEISQENCSKCGLLFPTDILVSHLCKHHSQDTDITVEQVNKKSIEIVNTAQMNKAKPSVKDCIKLYKCSVCNVYFLNQNTCYRHTYYEHEVLDPKQYIECKICSLQFRIQSLSSHIKRHHEKEFNLEEVLVEEYHPSTGRQAPKINIYYASERFENVQVSSSND